MSEKSVNTAEKLARVNTAEKIARVSMAEKLTRDGMAEKLTRTVNGGKLPQRAFKRRAPPPGTDPINLVSFWKTAAAGGLNTIIEPGLNMAQSVRRVGAVLDMRGGVLSVTFDGVNWTPVVNVDTFVKTARNAIDAAALRVGECNTFVYDALTSVFTVED